MKQRKGISLIVLVVTITSTYDELIKTDIKPPKNKIEIMKKFINIDRATEIKSVAFTFRKNIV